MFFFGGEQPWGHGQTDWPMIKTLYGEAVGWKDFQTPQWPKPLPLIRESFFPLGSSKPWNAPGESLGPFEKHPKLSAGTWPKFFFEHVFRESKFRHHAMLNHKKQELEGLICKIVKSLYMFILNNFLWIKIHKISTKIQTWFNFVAPCNPFKGSSRDWIRLYASNSFLQLSGSVPISLAFDHWSWRLTWPKSMVVGNLVSQLHHRVQPTLHVYKITCFPQNSGKTIWRNGNEV